MRGNDFAFAAVAVRLASVARDDFVVARSLVCCHATISSVSTSADLGRDARWATGAITVAVAAFFLVGGVLSPIGRWRKILFGAIRSVASTTGMGRFLLSSRTKAVFSSGNVSGQPLKESTRQRRNSAFQSEASSHLLCVVYHNLEHFF